MNLPKELKYTKDHEWVRLEGNVAYIGITDFAQSELGDIVFVELPEVNDHTEADEPFGSVESVKTVSELFAPLSGKVIKVNERLADEPELVNSSPYEDAWMIAIELTNTDELDTLLDDEGYKQSISA